MDKECRKCAFWGVSEVLYDYCDNRLSPEYDSEKDGSDCCDYFNRTGTVEEG